MRKARLGILLISLALLTACTASRNAPAAPTLPAAPLSPIVTVTPPAEPALAARVAYAAALRPLVEAETQTAGMTEYRLALDLTPDLSQVLGQAQIRYTNRETLPLALVYLHLYPNLWDGGMTVADAQVAGRPVTVTYPTGDDAIGLPLDPPLAPGASVELTLRFTTPIPSGAGVGNYGELALQDGVLALAHCYPTVVVYDTGWRLETPAPHGDVIFHDASLYDVTLTAPADLTVVATGATLGQTANADGTVTWRLGGGPLRDFNIVASRDYRALSKLAGDIAVHSYFLPGDEAGGQQALAWAAQALEVYQQEFGAYPYRELDVVATGTSALGIEYPGLVAIAARLYSDASRQTAFESATAHEVAHQWWYNVVGNDQVRDPWLDEALAQYSTYLYYRDTYGEPGGQGFIESLDSRWARVQYAEQPIGLPAADYTGLEYGAIVYGRGAFFFLALRDRLGADQMTALLRRYYARTMWQIATPAGFRSDAEEMAGASLGDLFQKWVTP